MVNEFMDSILIKVILLLSVTQLCISQRTRLFGANKKPMKQRTIHTYNTNKHYNQLLFGEFVKYGVIRRSDGLYKSPIMLAQQTQCRGARCTRGGGNGASKCLSVDMVFILDCSGSIDDVSWKDSKDTVKSLASYFEHHPQGTNLAVLTFGTTSKIETHLKDVKMNNQFNDTVNKIIQRHGMTYLAKALNRTWEEIKEHRKTVHNFCVIITDGMANGPGNVLEASRILRSYDDDGGNCETYVIGVGKHLKKEKLANLLTGGSEDKVYVVENHKTLLKTSLLCYGDHQKVIPTEKPSSIDAPIS